MNQTRKIGKTELEVSPVAMGCWPIAGMTSLDVNDAQSLATIRAAIDSGVNFFDTAFGYGANGESERLLGKAIDERARTQRDEIVIASKAGMHWEKDAQGTLQRVFDASPARIASQCDESLQRLNVDVIDLYYLHAPDPSVPIQTSAAALALLMEQGKVRCVGVSNLTVEQMEQFETACPISAVQPPYNMLQRDIERDLIPWCQERSISVVNYWPLMKGLLAGKIRRGHQFDPADSRLKYEVFQGAAFDRAQELLDVLDVIAARHQVPVAAVVARWTIHQPGITATLCGAKRPWQIEETALAMTLELDDSEYSAIQAWLDE